MAAMNRHLLHALLAAALFGASTPLAKMLVGEMAPVLLAGLLYLGSGLGLTLLRLVRDRGIKPSGLEKPDWPWLLGAIAFGGIMAPVALMFGLSRTSGSAASLLLNLETVLTAVIAWTVFRESVDRRILLGMLAIVAGGVVLSWPAGGAAASDWVGPAAIALACLCWAVDNNLTRKVSSADALFVAGSKGLVAGLVNTSLALLLGSTLPGMATFGLTLTLGMLAYGVSLVLFVLALRGLGTARTGAYFASAPFMGAALSLTLLGEATTPAFWLATALMAWGVWLHLTERHAHSHTHDPQTHAHPHEHDEHHQHTHDFAWDMRKSHNHRHVHSALTHSHHHFPDIHHRHPHGG